MYNINNLENKYHKLLLSQVNNSFTQDVLFKKWMLLHSKMYGDSETQMLYNSPSTINGYEKLVSLKPLNPKNAPDKWEKNALELFENKKMSEFSQYQEEKNIKYFRYIKAFFVEKHCLQCHESQGYKEGDIRGGLSISIPTTFYDSEKDKEIFFMVSLHIVLLAFGLIFTALIIHKLKEAQTTLLLKHELLNNQSKMNAMSEMLTNISHQWRQPLAVISMSINNILADIELQLIDKKNLEGSLLRINDQAQYLSKTIDSFRNFFANDTEIKTFKINKVIEGVITPLQINLENDKIEIIQQLEDIEVKSYQNELTQAILNILNNAEDILKSLASDKRYIFINTKLQDKTVVIEVYDNAGGIPDTIIHKICEPYFTTKHQSQGKGLGLYMTNEIITKHLNGELIIENTEYTYQEEHYSGAKFTIKLPLI
jgi:signal transduction histidine kinase